MAFSIVLCGILFNGAVVCLATSEDFEHKIDLKNMEFEWKLVNDTIKVRLAAKTTGWVGIGFNPSKEMKDANFIIGYVKGGKAKVTDHYGTTNRQHQKDQKLGGERNVTEISGQEQNGITEIRFTIPLNSNDAKDQPILVDQQNTILLAHGAGRDSFRAKHEFRSKLTVDLKTGQFTIIKQSRK